MESQKPKTNYRLLTKFIGIIPSLNILYEKKDMQKEVDFSEKGFAWAEMDGHYSWVLQQDTSTNRWKMIDNHIR